MTFWIKICADQFKSWLGFSYFFMYMDWMKDIIKAHWLSGKRDPGCVQSHCVCDRCYLKFKWVSSMFCLDSFPLVFFPPYILDCMLSFQLHRTHSVNSSSAHRRTAALSPSSYWDNEQRRLMCLIAAPSQVFTFTDEIKWKHVKSKSHFLAYLYGIHLRKRKNSLNGNAL